MNTELQIPGFVDLQVNGFKGVDFSSPDLTEDGFVEACRNLRTEGTAAFLPTLITAPVEVYARNLPMIARIMARPEFRPMLPGIHLEGPFLSDKPGAVGAHPPECTRAPDIELLKRLINWADGRLKMLTVAPELEGCEALIRTATEAGIVVSVGHTLATAEELAMARRAGARTFTHLGNALASPQPKLDNTIWTILADDGYTAMFIADGHHIPNAALKAMIRAKGVGRTIITSDASPPAGFPPGRYHALGQEVEINSEGRLFNPEKGFMVGSSATLVQCMNHLASLDFLTLDDLTAIGFSNPLKMIGVEPEAVDTSQGIRFEEQFQVC